jgi:Na+-driven multidrug efflux pump
MSYREVKRRTKAERMLAIVLALSLVMGMISVIPTHVFAEEIIEAQAGLQNPNFDTPPPCG